MDHEEDESDRQADRGDVERVVGEPGECHPCASRYLRYLGDRFAAGRWRAMAFSVVLIALIAIKKIGLKSAVPFGPVLIAAAFVAVLVG